MGHEISPTEAARLARMHAQKMGLEQRVLAQVVAKEQFQEWAEKGDFDIGRNFSTLEEEKLKQQKVKAVEKKQATDEEDAHIVIEESSGSEDLANQFERDNPELKTQTLLILRSLLSEKDTPEEILEKVQSIYKDPSLADEALEFLLATTSGALKKNVQKAAQAFRERYGREIAAGKNIFQESRDFSSQGLGSPTALRDMYRDITGNIRDPQTLFDELFKKYSYEKMKPTIEFLLSSYGSDLRSKGPSIEKGELLKLLDDARSLQAILGVYRFFKERMNLIFYQASVYETHFSDDLHFELLAKQYMQALKERYPSPTKFRDLGKALRIRKDLAKEIIIYTQMRDAVRGVSPKLYRDERHRKNLLKTWIELLEELEEEYEKEDEET